MAPTRVALPCVLLLLLLLQSRTSLAAVANDFKQCNNGTVGGTAGASKATCALRLGEAACLRVPSYADEIAWFSCQFMTAQSTKGTAHWWPYNSGASLLRFDVPNPRVVQPGVRPQNSCTYTFAVTNKNANGMVANTLQGGFVFNEETSDNNFNTWPSLPFLSCVAAPGKSCAVTMSLHPSWLSKLGTPLGSVMGSAIKFDKIPSKNASTSVMYEASDAACTASSSTRPLTLLNETMQLGSQVAIQTNASRPRGAMWYTLGRRSYIVNYVSSLEWQVRSAKAPVVVFLSKRSDLSKFQTDTCSDLDDVCDWTSASARALAVNGTYCFAKSCTYSVPNLKPIYSPDVADSYVLTVTTAKSYRANGNAAFSYRKTRVSALTEVSAWASGKMQPRPA